MTVVPQVTGETPPTPITIIIPARNEAINLPRLLQSLEDTAPALEVIVVDDHSTDDTARIAQAHGARVLPSQPLQLGWTGKTWACWQGANAATSTLLLFLDADTYFARGGLARLRCFYRTHHTGAALSVLPYHAVARPYEQLSLFFNLLMAAGAGGFSGLEQPKLFGQSLLIDRELYFRAGGHQAVRQQGLENLHLASQVAAAGGALVTAVGRGTLEMRMFPEGYTQLLQGWKRGSADGAAAATPRSLLLSMAWIASATVAFIALAISRGSSGIAAAIYLLVVAQVYRVARRIGGFRWTTAVLYPLPLLFYFAVLGLSAGSRRLGKPSTWKGRQL